VVHQAATKNVPRFQETERVGLSAARAEFSVAPGFAPVYGDSPRSLRGEPGISRPSASPGFAPLCGACLLRPGLLYRELPAFFRGEPASLRSLILWKNETPKGAPPNSKGEWASLPIAKGIPGRPSPLPPVRLPVHLHSAENDYPKNIRPRVRDHPRPQALPPDSE